MKALFLTVNKLSFEEYNNIKNDFIRENFGDDIKSLDSWVTFYSKHGTFSGSDKLVILPQSKLPPFMKTDIPITPINL